MNLDAVEGLVVDLLPIVVLDQLLQGLPFLASGDVQTDDELEHLHLGEHLHSLLVEEVVDVLDVPLQEGQGLRVVSFHRLRHIDHVYLIVEVEQVVLTEVSVDELALLVQQPHDSQHLQVYAGELLLGLLDLSELWRRDAVLADEVHHQHIGLDQQGHRAGDDALDAVQVSQLLLSPHLHHLPGVGRAVAAPEPELALHVALPVLEHQDRSLVDLDRVLLLAFLTVLDRVVDIGLLAGGEAAIDLAKGVVVDELLEDEDCLGVQHLLDGSPLYLVLVPLLLHELLILAGLHPGQT